jgi:hypothetical protein
MLRLHIHYISIWSEKVQHNVSSAIDVHQSCLDVIAMIGCERFRHERIPSTSSLYRTKWTPEIPIIATVLGDIAINFPGQPNPLIDSGTGYDGDSCVLTPGPAPTVCNEAPKR